jgi:hypothetical protein
MTRIHETFTRAHQPTGCRIGDILIIVIVCLSAISIFGQASTAIEGAEKEKDKRAIMCLKEFRDN